MAFDKQAPLMLSRPTSSNLAKGLVQVGNQDCGRSPKKINPARGRDEANRKQCHALKSGRSRLTFRRHDGGLDCPRP